MPAESERQRKFMAADRERARAGQKTRTGMSSEQLGDYVHKPAKGYSKTKKKGYQMPNTTVSGVVVPPPERYAAPTTGVLDTSFMIVTYALMVPLVPTIVTQALRNNAEWQDQNPSFVTPPKLPAGQTSSVPAYAAPPAGGGTANAPAGELVHATGCTAGAPGTWTPGGCRIPVSIVDAPRPTVLTNWTVGQYIVLRGGGTANEINWNGTAYVAGRHA